VQGHLFFFASVCVRVKVGLLCVWQAGITTADRVVTVSPGYSEEIRTWLGGWGLEGMLSDRGFVLNGIVNGIDDE
jgi:starch synthase